VATSSSHVQIQSGYPQTATPGGTKLKKLILGLVAIVAVLAAAPLASSSSITLGNANFNTLPGSSLNEGTCGIAPGCYSDSGMGGYTSTTAIPDWTVTAGASSGSYPGGEFQPTLPPASGSVFSYLPDGAGDVIGWTQSGTISQTATGTAAAGEYLTLSVMVGERTDQPAATDAVILEIGTQMYDATPVTLVDGGWVDWTVSAENTSGSDQSVEVWLENDAGGQGLFDDVTLTAPEGGTTLVLLGLAVAGLAGLRRKLGV